MKPIVTVFVRSFVAAFTISLAAAAPQALKLEISGPVPVARHERLDLVIQWEQTYANPYDPALVDTRVLFQSPSGKTLELPAFYSQPHEYRAMTHPGQDKEWFYPVGPSQWLARFTPTETGIYQAQARVSDHAGTRLSEAISFECTPGTRPGFVRVSQQDPRFFEFEDGTPFFPIGQNLAFIGSSQYLDTKRAAAAFEKMGRQGANFARLWACSEDWAMAIEARKSAWGRSWDWHPPLAGPPGNDGYHSPAPAVQLIPDQRDSWTVSPSHPVALRPDTTYRLSGRVMMQGDAALEVALGGQNLGEPITRPRPGQWNRWEREIKTQQDQWWLSPLTLRATGSGSVWLQNLLLQEPPNGPNLLWEADLSRTPRGWYNQPDCAMLDRLVEAAEAHGIYLQLCLLTRDHYRHALTDPTSSAYALAIADAKKLLRYAVARWGYSPHVFAWEYFNEMDPNAPTESFHTALGHYLADIDPYHHLRTTSGWGPAPRHWHHAQLDIADLHWYMRPTNGASWQDEVATLLDRTALLRAAVPRKPAVLGEFGLATDSWGHSPYMKQDRDQLHFHNSLWASAFSGLSSTASFWWWETLDQSNAYPHYGPLAAFLAETPWTSAQFQAQTSATDSGRARCLMWQGNRLLLGWFFNPQSTWWQGVVEQQQPSLLEGELLTLPAWPAGHYHVQWWDTRSGKIASTDPLSVEADGILRIPVVPFHRDVACKVLPR